MELKTAEKLRGVLDVLQRRIDTSNDGVSDLKECWNAISESVNEIEAEGERLAKLREMLETRKHVIKNYSHIKTIEGKFKLDAGRVEECEGIIYAIKLLDQLSNSKQEGK